MCGISGVATTGDVFGLDASLRAMKHRGPDAEGIWRGAVGKYNIGFGHLRLSIVDLTESANQPFVSADEERVLVYNGEIYNYRALRDELRSLGHRFSTESDTEVLFTAYAQWGIDCVRRFDGMFAFALLDRRKKQLYLARDPLGIKPLYVRKIDGGGIAFASEIRGLTPLTGRPLEADRSAFAEFLLNGWLYEPATGYIGIEKIRPGEYRSIDLTSSASQSTIYYDPLAAPAPRTDFETALKESMHLQRAADVKVGLFFSGGLDSSVLAAADEPLDSLFVEYSEGAAQSDAPFAQEIARNLGLPLKTVHHDPVREGPDAILENFRHVAYSTEELIADYTYSASEALSADARAAGYKVMLSGMGGDELFAGYPRYKMARYRAAVRASSPLLKAAGFALRKHASLEKKMDRLLRFSEEGRFIRAYTSLVGYFSESEVSALLGRADACEPFWNWSETTGKRIQHLTPLKQAMYLDRYGFLAHNLMVTDKSSMAASIEVRVPLMSNALADLGFSFPDADLIDRATGKKPLHAFLNKRLPRELLNRPKVGFNPPLDDKIRALGESRITDLLTSGPAASVLNMDVAKALVRSHFSGRVNQTYKLWQLLYFNFWVESISANAPVTTAA